MDKDYIIVSFATPSYAQYKTRLQEICVIDDVKGFTTKKNAYMYKPVFIKEKLLYYKKPVAWIDVDSVIYEKPKFESFDFDIGFVHRTNDIGIDKITSAFMVFNYTTNSFKFLEVWEYLCKDEDISPFGDHLRMLTARYLMTKKRKLYKEKNITDKVKNKIVFNPGTDREYKC